MPAHLISHVDVPQEGLQGGLPMSRRHFAVPSPRLLGHPFLVRQILFQFESPRIHVY
ncbi:hypothetical protein AQUCO_01000684v1 [Aquilegia coerulea]|uniref:Uncharacterized protein n=1 Tax=Aquilegia coerulea TaxID=218851 RepID=A0A2G5EB57_AQUCA|nr:hypothetical protein AQUCO_01000684v1 [Aquilegia coerulea]